MKNITQDQAYQMFLAGGMLVDNGGGTVYGINPIEFYSTHSFA